MQLKDCSLYQLYAHFSFVSNILDPLSFANTLVNDAAVSKFKMSVGTTSALLPDISDDLWCGNEPISLMIDLNNIEQSIELLEADVSAVGSCAKGVTPQHLSEVWSIDIENVKQTIDVTIQLRNHENSDRLSRQYSTNNGMLRYKRIKNYFFIDTFQVTKNTTS